MVVEKLYELSITTFASRKAPNANSNLLLCNVILNFGVDKLSCRDRYDRAGFYSPTRDMLVDCIEKDKMGHRQDGVLGGMFGCSCSSLPFSRKNK